MSTPQQKRTRRNKALYLRKRVPWLAARPWCERCGGPSDAVHHKAGRLGAALLDESRWMAVCSPCHTWITEHPAAAIEQGYSLPRIGRAS